MTNSLKKPIIVQKFGGSSLATTDQIKNIAKQIVERKNQGNHMVIVVSARGNTTDELLREAREITAPNPIHLRETDMLLSVGERISIAVIAIAINNLDCEATSLTGSQCGIITDTNHTNAKILEIRPERVLEELKKDRIVIVAGYQGVSTKKEITTLGRGGSDLTAIAMSVALGASQCEIYSDVDGICNSNPAENPKARLLSSITPEDMVEMAASGAKVIDLNGAKLWQKHAHDKIQLKIGNSRNPQGSGTIITNKHMSESRVTAVSTICGALLAETDNENSGKVLETLKNYNLLPVMFFKDPLKNRGCFVFEREASEMVLSEIEHLFHKIRDNHSVVAAVGKNIGCDMEIITAWESLMDEPNLNSQVRHTSYSSNRITSLVKNECMDAVKQRVYERFLD